jgi:hypothetical protein
MFYVQDIIWGLKNSNYVEIKIYVLFLITCYKNNKCLLLQFLKSGGK